MKKIYINESQESKSQSEAIKLVMSKLGYDYNKANSFVRNDLRNEVTSLRDKKLAKFTLGVTRMYCNGQIRDERTINDLNATLKLLSAHLDEYDRNLNGISASDLIQRFAQIRQDNIEQERNDINNMSFGETDYDIVRIDSFEEAKQYYVYTNPNSRWCLTYMEDMFDRYTSNGINQIYFCLKNGFEHVPCEVGANAPLDEYGLSMLSIIVNENGELAYCTTRWNHDNGGSDSSMSAKEVSKVVGVNFYEVFKPNGKWNELLQSVYEMLQNGEDPSDIFDNVGYFSEGCAVVELNNKYNFITTEGQFLSEQWFDYAYSFSEGFAVVRLNGKYNFITTEGQFLSEKWFNYASFFSEGFAVVKLNKKYNFIATEGQFLSEQWFDYVSFFSEGFAVVGLNGKYNFITTEGLLLSEQWFDYADDFNKRFAKVELNGKKYSIDKKGNLSLSENRNDILLNKNILNESQESKSQSNAIKYLQQKLGWDYDRANRFVRYELRMAIPSLRDKNLAKFTLGVTRMFMEEQLNDISKQRDLNETLRFLSAHLDEYDRNLNGISANDLIQRFAQIRKDNLEQEKNDINNMSFGDTDYEIVRIDSFEEAKLYYDYTNPNGRWCLTYMKDMFDRYSNNGMNQIYFCLKNGFENVPCEVGANAPLDDYGLSMLSIIVNENGELAYCTTRWNHDYGGSDSSMSAKEVSEVVGVNFYEVFKPNGKWNELLQSVHERLQNGESPSNIFDYVGSFSEGCAVVELNHKWNFITTKGKLIIEQWFDYAYSFRDGFAKVKLNRKFNFITTEGRFLSKQWFDDASVFIEGFARVKLNGKWNFITTEGKFLSKQWFDVIWNFKEGFAEVKLNNKFYYIDKNGQLYDERPHLSESMKRIYINENQLSLLNEYFNHEYDNVEYIKLYHGTSLEEVNDILENGFIDAKSGRSHGETSGVNWFSTKQGMNFYRGALFSIVVPKSDFENYMFNFMNNSEVTSYEKIDIKKYNFQLERVGEFSNLDNLRIYLSKCNNDLWEFYNRLISKDYYFSEIEYLDITQPLYIQLFRQLGISDDILKNEGFLTESKNIVKENLELEVEPNEVDLSSFEKQSELNPHFWKNYELNPKVRFKLLDIAEDFYRTLNIKFIKPIDIIMCGSMCNYNWSSYSDVDLHILIDFNEITDNSNILKDYFDLKKNEWNNEHTELNIYGYKVELYVQDINDNFTSSGIYSLEKNEWINKPSYNNVTDLSDKRQKRISKVVADIMTQIDDLYINYETYENDEYELSKISNKIDKILKNLKHIRKNGLQKNGELSLGNIVYKAIRRADYFNKLWELKVKIYDKINSIE